MPQREIFFPGGRYEMCEIIYAETEGNNITGKYMIALDSKGREHIVRQAYGTWAAYSTLDLLEAMKHRDRLMKPVQPDDEQRDMYVPDIDFVRYGL